MIEAYKISELAERAAAADSSYINGLNTALVQIESDRISAHGTIEQRRAAGLDTPDGAQTAHDNTDSSMDAKRARARDALRQKRDDELLKLRHDLDVCFTSLVDARRVLRHKARIDLFPPCTPATATALEVALNECETFAQLQDVYTDAHAAHDSAACAWIELHYAPHLVRLNATTENADALSGMMALEQHERSTGYAMQWSQLESAAEDARKALYKRCTMTEAINAGSDPDRLTF